MLARKLMMLATDAKKIEYLRLTIGTIGIDILVNLWYNFIYEVT